MTKFTDYLYATVPSFCLAAPLAQILPDLSFFQGLEKLGIVGIMGLGIIFFVAERRSFIAKNGEKLESVEKRLAELEKNVAIGNDQVVHLLGEQLDTLHEIKNGQVENFNRMWNITLRAINGKIPHDSVSLRPADDEKHVLRPQEDQGQS